LTRLVLDSGSQVNLISKELVNRMGDKAITKGTLPMIELNGLWGGRNVITDSVTITIKSRTSNFQRVIQAYIVEHILDLTPPQEPQIAHSFHDNNLADPQWFKPGEIELLIGGRDFAATLGPATPFPSADEPNALLTHLGWVIFDGQSMKEWRPHVKCALTTVTEDTSFCLKGTSARFWAVELIKEGTPLTADERFAEDHFCKNTAWTPGSRITVRMPLRGPTERIARTRALAYHRLCGVERKHNSDSRTWERYQAFIKEYLDLGHAEILPRNAPNDGAYHIPHHCVVREASTSTKLRVVFDANARTKDSLSLNQLQAVGRINQAPLADILIRFRCFRIGLTSDISKMFRCIDVARDQADMQRILWRFNSDSEPEQLRLLTVSYGTTSAPFLATRCLQLIAESIQDTDPNTAKWIMSAFYMDDFLAGADNVEEAALLQQNVSRALQSAHFRLCKWASNQAESLREVAPNDLEPGAVKLSDEDEHDHTIGALGIQWCPKKDTISFKVWLGDAKEHTKRTLLAEVMRIFDPLGLLSPLTIKFRALFQRVWQLGDCDWDSSLPEDIESEWHALRNEVEVLESLQLPRWFNCCTAENIELHAFCDASTMAYGAAIYARFENSATVHLILARGRVAPLRTITIPRLELLGAVMLADLVAHTQRALGLLMNITKIHAWSDSSIVLAWLRTAPSRFGAFV
jgi:Pao retrotransposon peptidase/Putative peptidase (DUF1758)